MDSIFYTKNILVVEDDPTYTKLWQRILNSIGITQITVTEDPLEAISLIHIKPIDLLISDITLSNMNGYQLAQKAREHLPKIEILLTTGYQTDLSRFDLKNPKFHLLHKPYTEILKIKKLLKEILSTHHPEEAFGEDSFSENEDYPEITEWTL